MPIPVFLVTALAVALCQGVCAATGFRAPPIDRCDVGLFGIALLLCHPVIRLRYRLLVPLVTIFQGIVLICFIGLPVILTLPYAVQAFNNPYQDALFIRFDRAIGFDYPKFIKWITDYPRVYEALGVAYCQFARISFLTLFAGMAFYRDRQIGAHFLIAFYIAVMLSSIVSGLFPAEGAVILLDPATAALVTGASPLDHLQDLRGGLMHSLPRDMGGIISFPSMHVGLGLLMLYYTRGTVLFYCAVIPASLFIVTAMTHGGHYLADCFAAVLVVIVACALTRGLFGYRLGLELLRLRLTSPRQAT